MKKLTLNKLDIDVYKENLESGLTVYVAVKENSNRNYVALTTRYGSDTISFVPRGKKKMMDVPLGVAHFLEHQMFEMEDGTNPLEEFSKSGSDANAYTNNNQTCYLFAGVHNALENLEYLLKYVSEPYFTDQSVEKEKGIIIEELKMYADMPDTVLYNTIFKNTMKLHPSKEPVIGTIQDIKKTTKEDLYTCYETFYHPSNMYLLVVGNVDPKAVIEIARNSSLNQKHQKDKKETVQVKHYDEPKTVVKKYEKKTLDIVLPKIAITWKLNLEHKSVEEKKKLNQYVSILFSSKFGSSSLCLEELRNEGIISDILYLDRVTVDDYALYMMIGETKEYEALLEKVKKEMKEITISKEDFERKKKVLISSYIYMSDNVDSIAESLDETIYYYHQVEDDWYQFLKDLTWEEMNEMIKTIDFNHYSVVVLESEK